jgi:3-dehydroquinate synthase
MESKSAGSPRDMLRPFVLGEYRQKFSVSFEYPVFFTRGVFGLSNPILRDVLAPEACGESRRVQVFVDAGLSDAWPGIREKIHAYFLQNRPALDLVTEPELVPGGERAKNSRAAAEHVMESLAERHLCRQSCVVAVGGGSMLDIVGLASSLVHRGLRLVRVPTTTLSQCDSGVGVKNGIDAYGMKNFAGTFAPPAAVVKDFEFLRTQDDRYFLGGLAEAFKVAMIRDREFFDFLVANAARLGAREQKPAEEAVRRAAVIHLQHIAGSGDPFEFGTARPLDFGHWSAHRLELMSRYELGHGQAVSIGIAMDTCYACEKGFIPVSEREAVLGALEACRLPIWHPLLSVRAAGGRREVLRGLEDFREHLGGRLTVTLPRPIGSRVEVHEMDAGTVDGAIDVLMVRAGGC